MDAVARHGFCASINQLRWKCGFPGNAHPFIQAGHELWCNGVSRFDLDSLQQASLFDDDINFVADVIAPKIEVGWQTRIPALLQQLADDEVLEQRPPCRMNGKMLGVADALQKCGEPWILMNYPG